MLMMSLTRSLNELLSSKMGEINEDYLLGSGLWDGEREEAMAGVDKEKDNTLMS